MKSLICAALLLIACGIAHAQAPNIAPPRCMPMQFPNNFHQGTSALGSSVFVVWCDDQIGLETWMSAGNPATTLSQAPAACSQLFTAFSFTLAWMQSAWAQCMVRVPTQDEMTEFAVLYKQWTPRLSVTSGSNQNVYTAKADGSRGPQFVSGGFGMQVAPGQPCGGARLQNAGARYADVSGLNSTNGVLLPAGSYARCDITYPPAGGFTN